MARRELRVLRVIESSSSPRGSVMAALARGREEQWLRGVARIRGVVVVRLMATNAGRWQRCVVIVHMAIRANSRRHQV